MKKLLILIIVFLLASINLYPQRNDGLRNEKIDSGRITVNEKNPARTLPTKNPGVPEKERQRDNGTIVYPKHPVDPQPPRDFIPIDNNCPVKPISVYSDMYIQQRSPKVIAMELFMLEDYYNASVAFTNLLVSNPYNLSALFYRGRCYVEMEWYGFAIEDFNLVIKLDTEHAEAYYFRAIARYFRNEKNLAQSDFEIAYQLDYKLAGIFLNKYF
ncbi:MAG: hypothetical protein R6W68_09065 [Ignavibacteriaceae bacterium]